MIPCPACSGRCYTLAPVPGGPEHIPLRCPVCAGEGVVTPRPSLPHVDPFGEEED